MLSVEECQQRLSQTFSVKRSLGGILSISGPVQGKVRGLGFHMHRRPNYGNIFFPLLFGALASRPKGTFVQARVHFPLASILLAVFFSLLGFMFQLNNLLTLFPERSLSSWLIYLWPSLVFGSICVIVTGIGVIMYVRDSIFLKRHIRALLNASDEYDI